jgi:hypothetical protein
MPFWFKSTAAYLPAGNVMLYECVSPAAMGCSIGFSGSREEESWVA